MVPAGTHAVRPVSRSARENHDSSVALMQVDQTSTLHLLGARSYFELILGPDGIGPEEALDAHFRRTLLSLSRPRHLLGLVRFSFWPAPSVGTLPPCARRYEWPRSFPLLHRSASYS